MNLTQYTIHVDQLVPGVYVELDLKDKRSPFLRKSFKIKDQRQIEKIKGLGLTHVTCILDKCDQLPLPPEKSKKKQEKGPDQKQKEKPKTPVSKELLGLKKETLERNKERRERFAKCEKRYVQTVSQVVTLLRRVSGRSGEAAVEAAKVVDALAETFLSQQDVVMSLMSTRPGEDAKNYHALNVTVLAMMVGKELGLKSEAMHVLGMGALFHDIGKGRVPIHTMGKQGVTSMQRAEEKYYQEHPRLGAGIASDLPDFPQQSVRIILQHHEAVDGKGFPDKIPGDKISPYAKIVSIVDVYDNLLNKRDPGECYTPHEALKYMYAKMRSRLDVKLLAVFIRNMSVYPAGTVVEMSNGAVGIVVTVNPKNSTRPTVLIYHPEIPKSEALMVDLAVEDRLKIVNTIRPENLSREVFSYLSPSRQINYYVDVQ